MPPGVLFSKSRRAAFCVLQRGGLAEPTKKWAGFRHSGGKDVYKRQVSVVLLFVWPVIFDALVAIGTGIAGMGGIGAGIYAFLNRLLIPTGLHHALNNVFWFDTIGLGDLSHFWAGETSADAVSYTHLDVYKRQAQYTTDLSRIKAVRNQKTGRNFPENMV